jgi:hypothetical protein
MRAACSVRVASPGGRLEPSVGAPSMVKGNATIAPFPVTRRIYFRGVRRLPDFGQVTSMGHAAMQVQRCCRLPENATHTWSSSCPAPRGQGGGSQGNNGTAVPQNRPPARYFGRGAITLPPAPSTRCTGFLGRYSVRYPQGRIAPF